MKKLHMLLSTLLTSSLIACNSGGSMPGNLTQTSSGDEVKIAPGSRTKDFTTFNNDQLKGSSIAKMAKSALGFEFVINKKDLKKGQCTGVALTKNLILTAAHCVVPLGKDQAYIQPGESLNVALPYDSNQDQYVTKPIKKEFTVENVYYKFSKNKTKNEIIYSGEDVALIKVKESLPFPLPRAAFHFNYLNSSYEILAEMLFEGSQNVWAIGYGSNSKFQYGFTSVYDKLLPEVLNAYFPTLRDGYDSVNNIYEFSGKDLHLVQKQGGAEVSNVSILIHDIPVENGDSGGPIFICQKINNCFLVGITQGGETHISGVDERATTLVTKAFNELSELAQIEVLAQS